MNFDEHIEYAEKLLQSAKDIAKREKTSEVDKKNDQHMVIDLLDFSRAHAQIAAALAAGGRQNVHIPDPLTLPPPGWDCPPGTRGCEVHS